jgi:hypothetical protein
MGLRDKKQVSLEGSTSRPLWITRELIKNFPGEEYSPGPSGPPEGFFIFIQFFVIFTTSPQEGSTLYRVEMNCGNGE